MTSDPIARYLATRGVKLGRRERLRVMNPSEVINTSLRVYRQLGWTYLRLTLVPTTFCLAGVAFVLEYVLPSFFETHHANQWGAQVGEAGVSLALGFLVGGPLFLIGFSYTSALVVHLTSDYMLGNDVDTAAAARAARTGIGALFLVCCRELLISSSGVLVSGLILGLGAFLSSKGINDDLGGVLFGIGCVGLGVGGVIFLLVFVRHSLAPALVVIEKLSSAKAARRSAFLLKSHLHHPSGTPSLIIAMFYILFAGLIEWVSILAILSLIEAAQHVEGLLNGVPLLGIFLSSLSLVPPFVVIWTLLPVFATCVTIVYYERRIRLEGLDIEVLAAEAERPGASNRFDV